MDKQTRRAEIAERIVENIRESLKSVMDANIQLEADVLMLREDNERLRKLFAVSGAEVGFGTRAETGCVEYNLCSNQCLLTS